MKLNRRDFVFSLSALTVAPPVTLKSQASSVRKSSSDLAGFTSNENEILGHFCEQIIPTDDHPGAKDLGAVTFIERALKEAHPEWMQVYKSGLKSTDVCSREIYQKAFVELIFSEQTELLKRMEAGNLPYLNWYGYEPGEFFAMVKDHTMQACYSHPKWGGNKDKQAWKMIGYDDWWT